MQGTLQVPLRGPAQSLAAVRSGACEAVLRKQSAFTPVSSMAPSMAPTPLHGPPARPPTVSCAARHGMEEEKQGKSGSRAALAHAPDPSGQTKEGRGEAASLFQIPSRQPNALRSVTGNLSEVGRVGFAGVSAAWMPRPSPQGWVYGVPREPTPPRQVRHNPEPPLTLQLLLPLPLQ